MSRRAFTLLELIVSIALGMIVIAIAWSLFSRSKAAAMRTRDRVLIHQSASNIAEFMSRDFVNMSPSAAMFSRSQPAVLLANGDRTDTVEIVFMRATAPLKGPGWDAMQFRQDCHWVRWKFVRTSRPAGADWKVINHTLNRSQSTGVRSWSTTASLVPNTFVPFPMSTPLANYDRLWFANIPRPLRDASEGIDSLNNNRYNQPPSTVSSLDLGTVRGDIGDLTDLNNNDSVFSGQVCDLRLGWVDANSREFSVGSDAAADHKLDGLYMDVLGPTGNNYTAQMRGRPRIVRVSFTMANDAATLAIPFAFSFAGPGMPPPVGP